MSRTIPPSPDPNQDFNTALFSALIKQLIRLSVSVDLLKGQVFALASKIGLDPQIAMKMRAAFEVDLALRVREAENQFSQFSDPATWRELLELLEKSAAPDV